MWLVAQSASRPGLPRDVVEASEAGDAGAGAAAAAARTEATALRRRPCSIGYFSIDALVWQWFSSTIDERVWRALHGARQVTREWAHGRASARVGRARQPRLARRARIGRLAGEPLATRWRRCWSRYRFGLGLWLGSERGPGRCQCVAECSCARGRCGAQRRRSRREHQRR